MKTIYEVLKSNNLAENGFHLSVTRGEIRSDLDGFFTRPYLDWLTDERFLSIAGKEESNTLDVAGKEDFMLENALDAKTKVETKTVPDLVEEKVEEPFVDLGADNEETIMDSETVADDEDGFPDFDVMDIKDVKQYAIDHKVDITGLKKKSDIVDAIYDDLAE